MVLLSVTVWKYITPILKNIKPQRSAHSRIADKKEIYRSNCVGHKRINPLESLNASIAKEFTFKITETAGDAKIRDAAIY